ncbi:MAG TPA: hypothetical protein VMD49_07500 [Steroidobacteraceae bacterium]|nr:hypothetical protein [Steroidobacteraceae bacterium]
MKAPIVLTAAVSAALLIAACATVQSRVASQEDLLAAAGFDVKPANTAEREAELKRLPADKFVTRAKGDHFEYVYADPVVCNCLYVGNQSAFDAYKREVFQRHIADEQQLTAEMYQEPPGFWYGWNWAPWGWGPQFWWW